jgi:hypothetical protein
VTSKVVTSVARTKWEVGFASLIAPSSLCVAVSRYEYDRYAARWYQRTVSWTNIVVKVFLLIKVRRYGKDLELKYRDGDIGIDGL